MARLPRDTRIAIALMIAALIVLGIVAYFGYPHWGESDGG
jgi:hypothetical protein